MSGKPLWGRAAVATLLMGAWLQGFFLGPLADEAMDMVRTKIGSSWQWAPRLYACWCTCTYLLTNLVFNLVCQHKRQLDPTEIVLVPYDLIRLWLFVLGVAFVYLVSTAQLQHLVHIVVMTFATWLAYIIYGAPPTENPWHTAAVALYLVLLIQWDPPVWKTNERAVSSRLNALQRLSLACSSRTAAHQQSSTAADRLAIVHTRVICCLTIVLHILRLYDRGWQPQRWPVPTILGASVGWMAGPWIGLVLETLTMRGAAGTKGKR